MPNTTDQLIQQAKDELESRLTGDAYEAKEIANVIVTLVEAKRLEQFIENEKEEQ